MAKKGNCKADSCEKEVVGKGYCKRHYRLWKRGEMPKARYATCVSEGCHKRVLKSMRCEEHQKVRPPESTDAAAAAAEAPAEEAPTAAAEPPAEEAPAEETTAAPES